MQLNRASVALEYQAFCTKLALQYVADRLERRMVRTGYDQLRKPSRGECVEGISASHESRSTTSARVPSRG